MVARRHLVVTCPVCGAGKVKVVERAGVQLMGDHVVEGTRFRCPTSFGPLRTAENMSWYDEED